MQYVRKTLNLLLKIFLIWFLYAVLCLVLPPLFHRSVEDNLNKEAFSRSVEGRGTPERVLSIDNNKDALIWRLRLIEAAQERIVLTTFDFRDDNSGRDIIAALMHAADRGVEVQILVDGIYGIMGLSGSTSFWELEAHENVEAKLYNPVDLIKPWKANYRMHDKYLIADDFAYILGGRNTDDLFLGEYVDKYNDDRDILVYEPVPGQGKSYRQLQNYFKEIWELPCNKDYEKYKIAVGAKTSAETLAEHYEWMQAEYPEAFIDTDWEEATVETGGIELYTNPVEPVNKEPVLWGGLVNEMKKGKDILIQTPYIICSGKMYEDLTKLSSKGADIQLVINAVESGTNPFGCTDYLNQKKKIQKTGADTFEFLGDQAAHTKTILIDGNISIVGSCNLDMRSIYLDTEMMLVIDSAELNTRIRSQIEQMKEQSKHVSADGTTENGREYQAQEQGLGKKAFYTVLRVLIIPLRHLL